MQPLAQAVRANDLALVGSLLEERPELINYDMASNDERRAVHFAVLHRHPEMTRLLMRRGADARKGIYPHRDATSAYTLAADRGYSEIVAIIEEEEAVRQLQPVSSPRQPEDEPESAAVIEGDEPWLRDRHAAGALSNPIRHWGGMLTLAVRHDRPEILRLLLDLRFDANERTRVEGLEDVEFTSGMPLWRCAIDGKLEMARMLLERGADPNAQVYASGSPVHCAYGRRDPAMIELLESFGGQVGPITVGLYRHTEVARKMLSGEIACRLEDGRFAGSTLAEQLLWGAACGGDPEIVSICLDRILWPRGDARWYPMLEQPVRFWNHMDGAWAQPDLDRSGYLACFKLLLERADPNIRGRFGITILHDLAASRAHVTAADHIAFATALLDAGARLDLRDELLESTPLGWACRWGRIELVRLLLASGADPAERDAEPWTAPKAWAARMHHSDILAALG